MAVLGLGVYFSREEFGECLHRLLGGEAAQRGGEETAAGENGDDTAEDRPN